MTGSVRILSSAGLAVLEQAVVLPILLALILGAFDAMNVLRARSAVSEAAYDAADYYSRLGTETAEGGKLQKAIEIARRDLESVFPKATLNCVSTEKNCLKIELTPPANPGDPVQVVVEYNLPLIVLAMNPVTISRTVRRQPESSYKTDSFGDICYDNCQ
ncbi:MAG: pilus assembly protein [Candidatus Dadabacteria bacterium]|nr:MAG: pilus assembly protein [Candidatus Dadabacteria bacterium]